MKESIYLSYILRHGAIKEGLTIDRNGGWIAIDDIVNHSQSSEYPLTKEIILDIVSTDSKTRYVVDGERIRATQGHSMDIKPVLTKKIPPIPLYHGTSEKAIDSILKQGLIPGNRHHVHLSADISTAENVGGRGKRGKPIILQIDTKAMVEDGITFWVSDNNVWFVDTVNPRYIVKL
jgi:putative RNA 2'-phosphotransferase